jgi:hypothetical protein
MLSILMIGAGMRFPVGGPIASTMGKLQNHVNCENKIMTII